MKNKELEQQAIYNLIQIIEAFPQYTISQHMWHILRTKGYEKEPYQWDNLTTLSKIEAYYNELNNDLLTETNEDDDY